MLLLLWMSELFFCDGDEVCPKHVEKKKDFQLILSPKKMSGTSRPRGQPLSGTEGGESEKNQTPRSSSGSSVGPRVECSPATPGKSTKTPSSWVRNSSKQSGAQNRGGVLKTTGNHRFGTTLSSVGPARTPQTRCKEFSLEQGRPKAPRANSNQTSSLGNFSFVFKQ